MLQAPVDGRYGFVFHEACWALLEEFYHPEAVPSARLLEVCKSLPYPIEGSGISWGHDFGGLHYIDDQDRYPWEDRVFLQNRDPRTPPHQSARENPFDMPEIRQLLRETPQSPPDGNELDCLERSTSRNGFFTRLPPEICSIVAAHLSTPDVFNLRQASKDFLFAFSSQQFWASRFKPNGSRSWLFETRDGNKPKDWRWLYHCTNDSHITPALANRKRVWKLVQPLQEVLSLHSIKSFGSALPQSNLANLRWKEVAADVRKEIRPLYNSFHEGCFKFHKQRTIVPALLSKIAFSIIGLGGTRYISGMRLISSKEVDVVLGYQADGKEHFLDVIVLRGFNLAIGARGIHAIQVITDETCVPQWFGCPDECPRTRYLAASRPIAFLEAGFDVS